MALWTSNLLFIYGVALALWTVFESGSDVMASRCGCDAAMMSSPLPMPRNENETIIVGDMILDKSDVIKMNGKNQFRQAEMNKLWPRNVVPYLFDDGYSNAEKQLIRDSMKYLQTYVYDCVRFREVTLATVPKDAVVVVQRSMPCRSAVGRQTEAQTLSLGEKCLKREIIVHELMHVLGFVHEQQRPDREQHVEILFRNIKSDTCNDYRICTGCKVLLPKYDPHSIMQYSSATNSCNGRPTVLYRGIPSNIPGNLLLTQSDGQRIMKAYRCSIPKNGF